MYLLRRRSPHPGSSSATVAVAELLDPTMQRILIVEDSDCLRAVAVRTLSARGYAVAEARHGEDALRVIEETAEPFDLVVTEMMMPVMSGYKLGRRLSRQRPGLPVLYISAGASESLASSGQFLQKPFLPEDLVRHVSESLRPLALLAPCPRS
jgi:CheY-like chemotaxis protein